ncbi:DivIVA domain-containing protein [Agrococcus jejuensis]|uniref:DivIVA domain-containing protein n=1 Tax=Agrococcus jejuensis TaxID=399736 RepID=A0A1G8BDE6_9MICO|nr:DivIVA domain-containing protein [Agrococcus jejuensis]SDH30620.1 DivIVA domain-containing protein [Agrococcus jejuensis]
MSSIVHAQTVAEADLPRTSWRGYDQREVDALMDRAYRTLAQHEGGPDRLAADVASMRAVADDASQTDGARELAGRLAEATEQQNAAFVPLRATDLEGIGFTTRLAGSGYQRGAVDAMLARIHQALVAHESR